MIAIKHEIDSVQLVKDEIDDIRESLDRLEAESQRRKNKLLEQVMLAITLFMELEFQWHYRCHLILVLILVELSPLMNFFTPLVQQMPLCDSSFQMCYRRTKCPT